MPQTVSETLKKLQSRADSFRGLATDDTHPQVILLIQKAYAGLVASAEVLGQLEAAASSYVDKKVSSAKRNPAASSQSDLLPGSFALAAHSLSELYQSAALLSQGKDAEVLKHLGKKGLEIAAKIGAQVSGVEYVKEAAEVVGALQDIAQTGQLIRLRKEQARVATDLFRWLDDLTYICLTWNYAAQLFLLATQGKGNLPEDEIFALVLERTAKASQKWHTAKPQNDH